MRISDWSSDVCSSDLQRLEAVERWWRGQRPFQRRGAVAPWIGGAAFARHERAPYHHQEYQEARERDVGADRRHQVPAGEGGGVVRDPPRHAGEAEEKQREEGKGADDKGDQEKENDTGQS